MKYEWLVSDCGALSIVGWAPVSISAPISLSLSSPMFILFIVQVKQGNKQKLNLCVSACLPVSTISGGGGGEADVLFVLLSIEADWIRQRGRIIHL